MERDRESGRRTVGGIHQAMLKQVATISDTKIAAISECYPTLSTLLKAYHEAESIDAGRTLLQSISLQRFGGDSPRTRSAVAGNKSLGARSAAELYIAYGISGDHYDSACEENAPTLTYAQLIEAATSINPSQSQPPTAEHADDVALRDAIAASLAEMQVPPGTDKGLELASERKKMNNNDAATTEAIRLGRKRNSDISLDSSVGDNSVVGGSHIKARTEEKRVIEID